MNFRNLFCGFVAISCFAAVAPAFATSATVTVGTGGAGMSFSPSTVTINKGETVTFTYAGNGAAGAHNVHADDNSFRCAKGCDGDGHGGNGNLSSAAWTATVTFNTAGSFRYYCENHGAPGGQGMSGTVVVNDVAPPPPPPGQNINGGLSGNWFNPTANQGGHGFQIEILPNNGILAIWFVFNPAGTAQNWIYTQGSYDPTQSTVTIPAFLEQGGAFPPNFDSTKVTAPSWGDLTLSFSDCNNGTAAWKSNATSLAAGYGDVTFPIQRLTSIDGTTCP
jgi:plastocyanin